MRNELEHIETIERYLAGTMGTEERRSFEQQMDTDPALRDEVRLQQQVVERTQLMAFKRDVRSMHKELAGEEKRGWGRVFLNSILALLGFCLSAVVTALLLGNAPQEQETERTEPVVQETIVADTTTVDPGHEEEYPDNEDHTAITDHHGSTDSGNRNRTTKKDTSKTNILVLNDADNQILKLHEGFIQSYSDQQIDVSMGGTVEMADSRSVINIPPGILVNKEGIQVIGTVEIRYREFRNPAEMVLSGIPMIYRQDSADYRFSSVGMFEIRAFQNGEELAVKPGESFTVDYQVTEPLDSCYFFALDDSTRSWENRGPIVFPAHPPKQERGSISTRVYDSGARKNFYRVTLRLYAEKEYNLQSTPYDSISWTPRSDEGNALAITRMGGIPAGSYVAEFTAEGYDRVVIPRVTVYGSKTTSIDVDLKGTKIRRGLFKRRQPNTSSAKVEVRDSVEVYQWVEMADQAETRISPDVVQGLRCENFGVYNCDQIHLVKAEVNVKAAYTDGNLQPITNGYNLAMIHLDYNASFGFEPDRFSFDQGARTVLLLFTRDNKVYVLPEHAFAGMGIAGNGSYTFQMTDITDRVKTSDELRLYLGL